VIIKFNGIGVGSVSELQEQVGKYHPGDKANVTYIRNGKESTVQVVLKNVDNTTRLVAPGEGAGVLFGARLESVSSEDKDNYRIENGLKVTELNDGRFKELGIRKGYIILSVNGKKVKSAADLKEFTNNGQSLTSIEGIQSNGTYFSYQFRR
jgi:serine protease Do